MSAETPVDRLGNILVDAMLTVVLVTDQGSALAAEVMGQAKKASCRGFMVLDVRVLEEIPAGGDLAASSDGQEVSVSFCKSSEEEQEEEEDREETKEEVHASATVATRDAYIYYTSGSSGQPKGVASGHGPMINRLRWLWQRWPFVEDEVCCQRVDHIFIDFVAEIFGPLSCGVPILVVPYPVRKNPVLLRDFIAQNGVTRITLVPTLARLLVDAAALTEFTSPTALSSSLGSQQPQHRHLSKTTTEFALLKNVRLWVLSGEALPLSVARGLALLSTPTATLLNLYGSTEVAADITFFSWNCGNLVVLTGGVGGSGRAEGGVMDGREQIPSVPIGRPIPNCGAELIEMTDELERGGEGVTCGGSPPKILHRIDPTEQGRVGMLYVYGAGLARGYWGREAATNKCFPSYAWDSASSCFRLCSTNIPETVPSQTKILAAHEPGDRDNHGGGGSYEGGRIVRFFCTGDLASFEKGFHGGDGGNDREESNLVYRGRVDQQIKINGQRFDLAEVEACLARVSGVMNGAAVTLTGHDIGDGAHGGCDRLSGLASGNLVGAVVSPETLDTAMVLAECRQNLPSFAVPQVIVVASAVPILPSSGKVDRREVRRMVLAHSHRQRNSRRGTDHSDTHEENASSWNGGIEKVMNIVTKAVVCTLQPSGDLDAFARQTEISENADLFTEVGLSSVQAVHLVHEIRRQLSASGRNVAHIVSLIDLYSHPNVRALAQRLLPLLDTSVGRGNEEGHGIVQEGELKTADITGARLTTGRKYYRSSDGDIDVVRNNLDSYSSSSRVDFTIRPITAHLKTKTVTLFSNVFLDSEPLLSCGLKRCRAFTGGVGVMIVRRCYTRLVSRNVNFLLRRGGRVLVAVDDATEQVLGFTVGTELIESTQGSGFFASDTGGPGNPREDPELAQGGCTNVPHRHTEATAWQRCTGWLLELPIRPMLQPVSALIDELLDIYQYERGWCYAPGEVMYISETGCRPNQRITCKSGSRHANGLRAAGTRGGTTSVGAGGGSGGSGVRGALMAELLERRLLQEASDAGFIRAVTICTNAVTAHVARELGFKEVARISPVQSYYPPGRQNTAGSCWRRLPRMTRQNLSSPRVGEHSSDRNRVQRDPRPGPFARVPVDHADSVLFEKVLVPGVPLELLLDQRQEEPVARPEDVAAPHVIALSATTTEVTALEYPAAALALAHLWQLVPVGRGSWGHHREMLTILANSLPGLASSGRATRCMTDDAEQGQAAFLLLNSPVTANGAETERQEGVTEPATAAAKDATRQPEATGDSASANDYLGSLASSPWKWAVVACMSWCRRANGEDNWSRPVKPVASAGERRGGERREDVAPLATSGRELLVLAVDRRWRYRGLGAALVAKFLAESQQDGESHVFVRSLPESVGFYERYGFQTIEGVGDNVEQDVECLMVQYLT